MLYNFNETFKICNIAATILLKLHNIATIKHFKKYFVLINLLVYFLYFCVKSKEIKIIE